jgi:hypothetical protein
LEFKERRKLMNGLNQHEILELLKLLQRMNLKQLIKLKEIIVEVESGTERLENLINDFNKLF